MEAHPIYLFHIRKDLMALRKFSKITDQYEIFDRTIQRRQHCCTTYRLQHHINNPFCNIFLRSVAIRFSEQRSSGMHRKIRQRTIANISNMQVYTGNVAFLGNCCNLPEFSNKRESPCKVPPPIAIPPICSIFSPLILTKEVPVPMLTTISWSISVA